jgi:hypothetical protein
MNEWITALTLQHADKLHLLFYGVQSIVNSVCCHQEGRKCGDQSREQPVKWRHGEVQFYVMLLPLPNPIRSQVVGTWQMNEQITALWYSRDEAMYGQAKVAIHGVNEWMNESAFWQRNFDRVCLEHYSLIMCDRFHLLIYGLQNIRIYLFKIFCLMWLNSANRTAKVCMDFGSLAG